MDAKSGTYLSAIEKCGTYPKLVLGSYAMPVYYPTDTDPTYTITVGKRSVSVRIPKGATPMAGSDGAMTLWDSGLGDVVGLHKAVYHSSSSSWTADGFDIYYLASNGLDGSLSESDEPRNDGHRGMSSAESFVPISEIQAGLIAHALKVATCSTASSHVFPATGDENHGDVIPEGMVLRIKPSVDLTKKGLSASALVVAQAMQTYGLVIGDTGGQGIALKLERDVDWSGLLTATSLSKLKFSSDFEFVQGGSRR